MVFLYNFFLQPYYDCLHIHLISLVLSLLISIIADSFIITNTTNIIIIRFVIVIVNTMVFSSYLYILKDITITVLISIALNSPSTAIILLLLSNYQLSNL